MLKLSSSQNTIIKEIRSLKNKKGREEKALFFVEGVKSCKEALFASAPIRYFAMSESFSKTAEMWEVQNIITDSGVKKYVLTDSLFGSVSDMQAPQGIMAVIDMVKRSESDLLPGNGILVILDSIRDPGNMGTIIRTADASGCDGVIITDDSVDVYNPKVLRSTMGSIFHIPVLYCATVSDAITFAKGKGYGIYAAHPRDAISIYQVDLSGKIAVIIGKESEGISQAAAENTDIFIAIPMKGRAESLNASVAAAVILFEAVRQKSIKKE